MLKRTKYGYPPQVRFSFSAFIEIAKVILLIVFTISTFVIIYKLIGFKAIAIIIGILTLISILVAIDQLESPIIQLAKMILLIAFFLFALVIMYKLTGFLVIGTIFGIFLLFSPMFLTKAATVTKKEPSMYLDPAYKGFTGNIYNDKD